MHEMQDSESSQTLLCDTHVSTNSDLRIFKAAPARNAHFCTAVGELHLASIKLGPVSGSFWAVCAAIFCRSTRLENYRAWQTSLPCNTFFGRQV